jgi:hypothetical protein
MGTILSGYRVMGVGSQDDANKTTMFVVIKIALNYCASFCTAWTFTDLTNVQNVRLCLNIFTFLVAG